MGTRWRGVLAPINAPTGDGRRMATGAFTHRPLPLPFRWQRSETDGHDDAVTIGTIDTMRVDEQAGHVWGEGELFDDVSPSTNPRLAEDVAEAKLLWQKGVIGPSVDPGSASAVAVIAGTDTPVTEQGMFELILAGASEVPTETLFTAYEIAGATLVPVPAFAECRPMELMDASAGLTAAAVREAVLAANVCIDESMFQNPELDEITPITRRKLSNGFTHVFGHVAEHHTCLVGQRDMCTTPPYSPSDYSSFHRYHDSDDGSMRFPLPVGRLTAGFGQFEDTCRCCPGNDDHACSNISFGAAVAHHDRLSTLAYVRAGEDDRNSAIWISGIEAPGIDERGQALLNRQKISGDWRENRGDMELTEVLVLNRRNPGFPLPRASMFGGRQRALTAAGTIKTPMERQMATIPPGPDVASLDYDRLGLVVAKALMAAAGGDEGENLPAAVTAAAEHSGAMLALRMTEEDAARLCVTDGEPMEDLHLTLAYLGKADEIPPEVREKIEAEGRKLAASLAGPVTVDGFAINAFNPGNTNDRDTALVLGVGGAELADIHRMVGEMGLGDHYEMPEQHSPFVPHVTLQYTDDLNRVKAMADRVGPVTFDRLRMAFGGENVDVPLGQPIVVGQGLDVGIAEMSRRESDEEHKEKECPEGKRLGPTGKCVDEDDDDDEMSAITAAVRTEGWSGLPLAPDDHDWDDSKAIKRLVEWSEGEIADKYAHAFLYQDSDMDADLQTAYKFPLADVLDGRLTIVPNAVRNALSRLPQADIPAQDETKARALLDKLMDRVHEQKRDEMTVGHDQRARAATASLTLAELAWNPFQKRARDGKWAEGGGGAGAGGPEGGDGGGKVSSRKVKRARKAADQLRKELEKGPFDWKDNYDRDMVKALDKAIEAGNEKVIDELVPRVQKAAKNRKG